MTSHTVSKCSSCWGEDLYVMQPWVFLFGTGKNLGQPLQKCFNIVKKLKCKSKPEDSVQSRDDVINDMSKGNYPDPAICALSKLQ